MSEPKEPKSERAPDDKWDIDEWNNAGFAAMERKDAAESAERRDVLIALLHSMTDSDLKLALLGLATKSLGFHREDQNLITEQDEVAAAWFAQIDQQRQARNEEFEQRKKLGAQLKRAITDCLATHPNPRYGQRKEDFGSSDAILGKFRGSYKGVEIEYRLMTLTSKGSDDTSDVAWLEIPQTPEPFDPISTDFGFNVNQNRTSYSMWRSGITEPVAVVGSVVMLSQAGTYCKGGLVLANPSNPTPSYFGSIGLFSSYRRTRDELPVIFDQPLRSYSESEAGRKTLTDPDTSQLKELFGLVNTSQPIELNQ